MFLHLRQELPYTLIQRPGTWREDPDTGALEIEHAILVRSGSQKVTTADDEVTSSL